MEQNESGGVILRDQNVAVVYAGQLLASTLWYSCVARFRVHNLLVAWNVIRTHHILVRWSEDVRFPRERTLFDTVVALPANDSCFYERWSLALLQCRAKMVYKSVGAGVRIARLRGCDYVLRVRVDIILETWELPERVRPECVYTFDHSAYGQSPSDNALFVHRTVAEAMFVLDDQWLINASTSAEQVLALRARAAGAYTCFLPFSVWLAKPDEKNRTRWQRSAGLRHWWGERASSITSHRQLELQALPTHLHLTQREQAACGLRKTLRVPLPPPT
jgi:hypothetical protein